MGKEEGCKKEETELGGTYHIHEYQVIISQLMLLHSLLAIICHVTQVACHCKLAQQDFLVHHVVCDVVSK